MTAPKSPSPSPAQEPRYPMPWPPITYVVVPSFDANAPLGRRMRIVKMGAR